MMCRILIKRTIWPYLSILLKKTGRPFKTIQVLVVDRQRQQVLLLRTPESPTGYFPVQGLREGFNFLHFRQYPDPDPRKDAQRELWEEAVENPPRLEKFILLDHYWEGRHQQFDCRMYGVDTDLNTLKLRPKTAEGTPVWISFGTAANLLDMNVKQQLLKLDTQQAQPGL